VSAEAARAILKQFARRLHGDAHGSFLVHRETYSREGVFLESLEWVRCTPRDVEGVVFYEVELTPLGLDELGGLELEAE